ncbi:MAG: DNA-processing protein DprA [Gammaproteobacteria bacterium]|nr:DNA-processing protein DprA [Gammaproteobacteria bacterium]
MSDDISVRARRSRQWLALCWGGRARIGRRLIREVLAGEVGLSDAVTRLDPDWRKVRAIASRCAALRIRILDYEHPRYPAAFRAIDTPPGVIFTRGRLRTLADLQIAIVGARRATPYGCEIAKQFAAELVRAGLTITSGLAAGIDAASHRGALDGGGHTVAVLGCGIDIAYPRANADLRNEIPAAGVLVSEYPPGSPPRAHHFPARNRLISALGHAVVVVEAGERSGSLITARTALEQGTEVLAVPGPIDHPLSKGCHSLIKSGAALVESAADILRELAPTLTAAMGDAPTRLPKSHADRAVSQAPLVHNRGLRDEAPRSGREDLGAHLSWLPTTVDELVERSGLTVETVSSMLLALELRGEARALVGGTFVRAH